MIAVAAVIVALAGGQAAPAAEPPGRLAGRVTAEGTNAPIASARVILMPAARPAGRFGPPAQTITDQEGRFAFERVAPGEYRVDVQKAGYAPLSDPFANNRQTMRVAA